MKAIVLALLTAVMVAGSAVAFASSPMNAGNCTCAPCPGGECPLGCCE